MGSPAAGVKGGGPIVRGKGEGRRETETKRERRKSVRNWPWRKETNLQNCKWLENCGGGEGRVQQALGQELSRNW